MDDATAADAEQVAATGRPRRRTSVIGIAGEVLLTVGVVVLLYVVWQLWLGDVIYGAQRNAEGEQLTTEWAAAPPATDSPAPSPSAEDPAPVEPVTAAPVVLPEPADAEVFAVLRVPRFGADYAVSIAGGVSRARTLDPIGIGHYPGTAMPGVAGNFAIAAHRTTWGKPFHLIAELEVGDAIVVEAPVGWYTYRFRTLEYVTPDAVSVLMPVPQASEIPGGTAYLTMTSCSPIGSDIERIIAYGVFESFTPREAGPPPSLTEKDA